MGIRDTYRCRLVAAALKLWRSVRWLAVAFGVGALCACSTQSLLSWESSDRTRPHYQVKSGDTLYSVAWGYDLDFRRLAVVNGLHPPYPLMPGQILRLPNGVSLINKPRVRGRGEASRPSASKPSKPAPTAPSSKRPTVASAPTPKPSVSQRPTVDTSTAGISVPNLGRWAWPNSGKVVKNWGAKKHQKSGLDIAASPGQPVTASAPGVVVYSGGGLARYGQLVILKHSEELLSAYAYNQSLLVKKGQQVKLGDKIALSGRSPNGAGVVHFEIRRRGVPVDALQYLKPRRG